MTPSLTDQQFQHMLSVYHDRNPGWGSLHIAMDDGNLETYHLEHCMEFAMEDNDPEGCLLAYVISQLSPQDRYELYNRY